METLKGVFILVSLLVSKVDGRHSQRVFKINIDERGTRFNETVEINSKENSVVYKVPKHNDIAQSEMYFDYKTGYFATRIPELKECYIQRIPEGQSSPSYVRKNLQQYRVLKRSKSTVPVKTIVTAVIKEQKVDLKIFSSSLSAFCGDFVAYKSKQVYHRNIFQPQQNETYGKRIGGRNIRSIVITTPTDILRSVQITLPQDGIWVDVTINTCKKLKEYKPALKKGGCFKKPDDWEYHCRVKTRTCIYSVKCKLADTGLGTKAMRCEESHFFTGWNCCDVKCAD